MSRSILYAGAAHVPAIFGNLIAREPVSSAWGFVNLLYPLTASLCLVWLLRRFLEPRFPFPRLTAGFLPFVLHFLAAALVGWKPGGGALLGYMAFLAALCGLFYRGPATAKAYLAFTFYTFYFLIMLAMEHTVLGLFQQVLEWNTPFDGGGVAPIFYTCPLFAEVPHSDGLAHRGVFDAIFLLALAGACGLMVCAAGYLALRLGKRSWNMERKALIFLLLPAGAGLSFYVFMTFVRQLLFADAAVDLARRYGPALYLLIPSLTVAFLAAILYSCDIYEQIMALGEEAGRADMLAAEVGQLETHIRDMEQIYTGIRSMKHDMKNYLFDIKYLLRTRGILVEEDEKGLGAYFAGIGQTLEQLDFCWHTGNPVTDVIVNGKYRQARELGVDFSSTFCFPEGFGISAFDLSVILNNALDNALEACRNLQKPGEKPGQVPWIKVEARVRNNMFFIEIANSFDGMLRCGKEGTLRTRKENALEHGLGFQNISRCAEKYLGAATYRQDGGAFYLSVMLQRTGDTR